MSMHRLEARACSRLDAPSSRARIETHTRALHGATHQRHPRRSARLATMQGVRLIHIVAHMPHTQVQQQVLRQERERERPPQHRRLREDSHRDAWTTLHHPQHAPSRHDVAQGPSDHAQIDTWTLCKGPNLIHALISLPEMLFVEHPHQHTGHLNLNQTVTSITLPLKLA